MTPFESYQTYLAIKQHFNSKSYDFFKYNGKVKSQIDAFNKRPDKKFFISASTKFTRVDFIERLLANFIEDDSSWIMNIFEDAGKKNYERFKKRVSSLTYQFKTDIMKLVPLIKEKQEKYTQYKGFVIPTLVSTRLGQPLLFTEYIRKNICAESLIILNEANTCEHFFDYWDKQFNNIIWNSIRLKCDKYKSFLVANYNLNDNKKKYEEILSTCFEELRVI